MAEYVRLGDSSNSPGGGNSPGGVLALPAGNGPAPAVLVTSAIAGLNDYVSGVVDQLAAEGYVALGLDYYARTAGPPDLGSPDKIMAAVAALSDPDVLDDVATSVAWLRASSRCDGRVGMVGFCIGGTYALLGASGVDDLACAVSFYGTLRYPSPSESKPIDPLTTAAKARCPLLGHYGDADHLIPAADVDELRAITRGMAAEIYSYPGAGHAFHEDFRPQVHRPVAAADAWRRTLVFLRYHLTSRFSASS
ncbi:hypothetical protein BJF90_08265 [Pseudonocardia sp. CNS-004]|nr:hypothetical protein BJF90_08265 [Pseudonocardia sp. CNS-004]